MSSTFNSNQHIELQVFIQTNCVDKIRFNRLCVRFNLVNYNQFSIIENTSEEDDRLVLEPNKIKELRFKFLPHQHDVGKDLEVSQISLELGNREKRVLVMHWKSDCKNALAFENQTKMAFSRRVNVVNNLDRLDWNSIPNTPITR